MRSHIKLGVQGSTPAIATGSAGGRTDGTTSVVPPLVSLGPAALSDLVLGFDLISLAQLTPVGL